MPFEEKARENLEAATRLLPDDHGDLEGLYNASASRSYYAAYLAVAHRAEAANIAFTNDDYYQHDSLPADARAWGILDAELSSDLRVLYGRRVKADYYQDDKSIDLEEANDAAESARAIIDQLLGKISR